MAEIVAAPEEGRDKETEVWTGAVAMSRNQSGHDIAAAPRLTEDR